MSVQITTAMVEQYSANVEFLAQQTNSRFSGKVRSESQAGKSKFYEQIGATSAVRITTRHGDTPRVDTNHQRRATYLNQYVWADLVDNLDQVELLIDPASAYAQNAAMAFNRAKDDEVIAAATGTAYADTGAGSGAVSAVALPSTQQIAVSYTDPANLTSGTNYGLTLNKLIAAKSILSIAEYPEGSTLYFAYQQQQLDNLLRSVTAFNDIHTAGVKALVNGDSQRFLGFEFVRSQRLAVSSGIATCFAFVESGLLLATGQDARGRVSERADKNYSTQVFMDMSIGATRMQEAYVVSVACSQVTAA
jgi:hypothetical protein